MSVYLYLFVDPRIEQCAEHWLIWAQTSDRLSCSWLLVAFSVKLELVRTRFGEGGGQLDR